MCVFDLRSLACFEGLATGPGACVHVCLRTCVFVYMRERVCVCVRERERERKRVCV